MLSRVADNLYWMRRYLERADQIARVVGVNLDLVFDRAPGEVARLWGRLLPALWSAPVWAQTSRARDDEPLTDLTSIDAVASCFAAARENARQVRQHITGELWERVNVAYLTLHDPARRDEWAERPHGYFQAVRTSAALIDAAVHGGMPRDERWYFVQLGLYLERAAATARFLNCQMREARPTGSDEGLDEQIEWICLLRACDALELYRQCCGAALEPDRIVRFLLSDPLSPRSLRYMLDEIARALAALGAAAPHQPPVKLTPRLLSKVDALSTGGRDLNSVVSAIETESYRIHSAVHETYIVHRRPAALVDQGGAPWTAR